jgi:hypothetical protein
MPTALTRMVAALVFCVALAVPEPAYAWGYEAHWFIMDRAIALLPAQLRPLFEKHRALVVQRAVDPDTWRTAGFDEEYPNHFLDLDWDGYGKDPYRELPRDFTAAVAKFGRERILENGTLPWRVEEVFGNLRRAFESLGRRGAFGQYEVMFTSAWLAHYVSDAHQPFHAVYNYDGQLTKQWGIHTRYEAILFERFNQQLTVAPKPLPAVANPRDFIFERVIEGTRLVPAILAADLAAIGDRDAYDDAYYAAFFKAGKPVYERRLAESISAVAAMITGAWEAAGKPALPPNPGSSPQRRRRS